MYMYKIYIYIYLSVIYMRVNMLYIYYIYIYMHGTSKIVQEAVEKKWKMNSKDFNARAMAAMASRGGNC